MFHIILNYIAALLCFFNTFVAFNVGMDHINFNSGESPVLMFPLAVFNLLLGYHMLSVANKLHEKHTLLKRSKK